MCPIVSLSYTDYELQLTLDEEEGGREEGRRIYICQQLRLNSQGHTENRGLVPPVGSIAWHFVIG
jgi:hypothetical protein